MPATGRLTFDLRVWVDLCEKAMMNGENWAQLLILSLLWGGSFFFVEVALEGLPVLTIVWCRVALASLLLALACILSGRCCRMVRLFGGPCLLWGF